MKPIGMIGHGAFGTAFATVLAHNGFRVLLWCPEADHAVDIKETRYNQPYFPGIKLDEKIEPTGDIRHVLEKCDWLFEAIPVKHLRSVCTQMKPWIDYERHRFITLSKGIEKDTLFFPTQLIQSIFSSELPVFACAGPSFAAELAQEVPTGLVIAGTHPSLLPTIAALIKNDFVTIEISKDLIGLQLGGALKNVGALGKGIIVGAGYGENTQGLYLTTLFNEMKQLAHAMVGTTNTLDGLSGFGDLVMSCMAKKSRNREVGIRFGNGQTIETILKETGHIPEGLNTVRSVIALQERYGSKLPVINAIYRVLFEQEEPRIIIKKLLE